MDKNYLDKVVDQIVNETTIVYDKGRLYTPFFPGRTLEYLYLTSKVHPYYFSKHCKNIYGLNRYEIVYVWDKYKRIIIDKLKDNGK